MKLRPKNQGSTLALCTFITLALLFGSMSALQVVRNNRDLLRASIAETNAENAAFNAAQHSVALAAEVSSAGTSANLLSDLDSKSQNFRDSIWTSDSTSYSITPVYPTGFNGDIFSVPRTSHNFQRLQFPFSRFNIKQTGSNRSIIGRAFVFRVETSAQLTDNINNPANQNKNVLNRENEVFYINILEIPTQLPAEGENFTIGDSNPNFTIAGEVVGKNVTVLDSNARSLRDVNSIFARGNISSQSAGTSSQVGVAIENLIRNQRTEDRHRGPKLGNITVAEMDASGASAVIVPVGERGGSVYRTGLPSDDQATLYSLPYFQTDARIQVSIAGGDRGFQVNAYDGGAGMLSRPAQQFTRLNQSFSDTDLTNLHPLRTFNGTLHNPPYYIAAVQRWNPIAREFQYMVEIDIEVLMRTYLPTILPAGRPFSLYVEVPTMTSPFHPNPVPIPLIVRYGRDLTRPFSIVSNGPIYIPSSFGSDGNMPFSVLAPEVFFGRPGHATSNISLRGQRVLTNTTANAQNAPNIAKVNLGTGGSAANSQIRYRPITDPTRLPPVFLRNWFIYVDKTPVVTIP